MSEAGTDPARSFFDGARPRLVGHRGDPAHHPDNSLAGVMSALDAVGAAEVDVRLTSDGHLLLSHDPHLAGLDVNGSDVGALLAVRPRPCLLDEVLALPGHLDLEVKNFPGEAGFDAGGRLALLVASRARPGDLVTSFYWPDVDLVAARTGAVPTGLVVGEGGSLSDALAHARAHGHRAVVAHDSLVTAPLCREARAGELEVVVWTVNSVDRARELSGMEVAAIISDDPLLIRNGLRE